VTKFNLSINLFTEDVKDTTDVAKALRGVADKLAKFTSQPWSPYALSGTIYGDGKRVIGTWSVDPEAVDDLQSTTASAIDRRRLADGDRALALPAPKNRAELREQLPIIHDGMLALQSLDDLGEEGNRRAHENFSKLEKRYDYLKARLEAGPLR
jgi:hypothetical protein